MTKWRIYRLPGSREVWHIDSGCGTQVFNVRGFEANVRTKAVDIGGNNVPRAWIEIDSRYFLHIINGVAMFDQFDVSPRNFCKVDNKCVASPAV